MAKKKTANKSKTSASSEFENPDKIYDLKGFCETAGISKPTFYRWLTENGLKDFSTRIGSSWRMTHRQYVRWIESREGIHDCDRNRIKDNKPLRKEGI